MGIIEEHDNQVCILVGGKTRGLVRSVKPDSLFPWHIESQLRISLMSQSATKRIPLSNEVNYIDYFNNFGF